MWKQFSKKASSADDCDSYAIFVKSKNQSGGVCYSYEVVESICVAVSYKVDEETATYGWKYEGGCFENGKISNFMPAVPGTDYNFDKLDFEIREILNEDDRQSSFSLSGLFKFLSVVCLIGALAAGGYALFLKYGQGSAGKSSSGS